MPLPQTGLLGEKENELIIAGLTGGIASGKSTVAGFLREAGARVIDADQIAREVVRRGTPAYDEIVAAFGQQILLPGGEIDRDRLGDIIFNDAAEKKRLDAIVHPRVFERAAQMIAAIGERVPDAVVILDIPLLMETGMQADLAEVIVVYVPETIQLERLMNREAIDKPAALARIRSQMPIEEKRRRATLVIDNSGSLTTSRKQAYAAYKRLKQRSG